MVGNASLVYACVPKNQRSNWRSPPFSLAGYCVTLVIRIPTNIAVRPITPEKRTSHNYRHSKSATQPSATSSYALLALRTGQTAKSHEPAFDFQRHPPAEPPPRRSPRPVRAEAV